VDTFTTVVYLLSWTLNIYAAWRITSVFYDKRRTPTWVVALTLLSAYALPVLTFLFIGMPLVSTVVGIVIYFTLTLNYESSFIRRVMATSSCMFLVIFAEFIAWIVVGAYQISLTAYSDVVDNILAYITIGPTSVMLAMIFCKFKNIKKNTITLPLFLISAVIIPVSSLAMLFSVVLHLPQTILTIVIVTMLGINFLVFYLNDTLSAAFEDKLKSALYIQEKEFYFAQLSLMQESVKNVRSIRHDMNLHLATIRDFISNNEDSTSYITSLLGDIADDELYSNTGNIAFDSITNFKLKTAKDNNIKLDLSLSIPSTINMEVVDIVTILGNLLDNALDAVSKVDEKIIKLDIAFDRGNLYINVSNSFNGDIRYTEGAQRGDTKSIATLKTGDNHGHGLNNIYKSVEKYNGHVDITYDDNVFSVGILLYVDDE